MGEKRASRVRSLFSFWTRSLKHGFCTVFSVSLFLYHCFCITVSVSLFLYHWFRVTGSVSLFLFLQDAPQAWSTKMNLVSLYIDGALIQATGGILTSVFFFRYRKHCPAAPLFLATITFFVLTTWIAIQSVPLDVSEDRLWGFLPFYASSLFFVPPLIAIINHLISGFLDGLTKAGHRSAKNDGDVLNAVLSGKSGWPEIRRLLNEFSRHPENRQIRSQVAELYLGMAYFDSALAEYRRLAETVPRGYEHAQVLHKIANVLIEKKRQPRLAVATLRQIVRLYPKSYFAAYARRWLNHLDAHVQSEVEFRHISDELRRADSEDEDGNGEGS